MVELGSILILTGKSQKGKNRVRELGKEWIVLDIQAHSPERYLICPENLDKDRMRWIERYNDPDFEWRKKYE